MLALHAIGLVLTDSAARPMLLLLLTGGLVLTRLLLGVVARNGDASRALLARSVLSLLLVNAAVAADGGTESPVFFWVLLLLAWQALLYPKQRLLLLGGVAAASYLTVVAVTGGFTPASALRFGLLVAFVLILVTGRMVLDDYQSRVGRMDDILSTLVRDLPVAVAVFDSDRETVLYANQAARELGLDDRAGMARLVADDPSQPSARATLGELVHSWGWEPLPPRRFRPVGDRQRVFQVGMLPRRLDNGAPILVVYGEELGPGAMA